MIISLNIAICTDSGDTQSIENITLVYFQWFWCWNTSCSTCILYLSGAMHSSLDCSATSCDNENVLHSSGERRVIPIIFFLTRDLGKRIWRYTGKTILIVDTSPMLYSKGVQDFTTVFEKRFFFFLTRVLLHQKAIERLQLSLQLRSHFIKNSCPCKISTNYRCNR